MDGANTLPDKNYEWIQPEEGVHEIYSNFVVPSWTLFDVRFRISQLIPGPKSEFVVEERAALTVSWAHAKMLRDGLSQLIANYEKVNGEIKPLKLPSTE